MKRDPALLRLGPSPQPLRSALERRLPDGPPWASIGERGRRELGNVAVPCRFRRRQVVIGDAGSDTMSAMPIHVTVPGSASDLREPFESPRGIVVHHTPPLHPDDVTVLHGILVTSVPRTLIDLAEELDIDDPRGCFQRAQARGLLDLDELRTARSRVEWRPWGWSTGSSRSSL